MEKELLNKFAAELERVGGKLTLINSPTKLLETIVTILNENKCKSAVLSSHPLFNSFSETLLRNNEVRFLKPNNLSKEKLSQIDAGISYSEYLIAETGTVVLINTEFEPSSISLLPEVSIVISSSERIVKDMSVAITRLVNDKYFQTSECITFITGPSRTADIEKVLVTGVHGPKKLYVVVLLTNINDH